MAIALRITTPGPRPRGRSRATVAQLVRLEADSVAPELATLWGSALEELRAHVTFQAIREVLAARQAWAVEAFFAPIIEQYLELPVRQIAPALFLETIQRTADALSRGLAQVLGATSFTAEIPATLPYLLTYTGSQVVGISATTRQAIQGTVRAGLSEGLGIEPLARQLREHIGISPRQAETLTRLRVTLETRGLRLSVINRRMEVAQRKAIRDRARVIARTESISVANAGQDELWHQAERQGLLRRSDWVRQWLTAADERTCTICRPMNGQRRQLDESFLTPGGTQVMFPSAHPACRCTVVLVRASVPQRQVA